MDIRSPFVFALASLGVAISLALAPPAWGERFSGIVAVVDGDTLRVGNVTVRLHGIDAPEIDQTCRNAAGVAWECGAWVRLELVRRAEGLRAACRQVDTDRYGRVVARCAAGGEDLGAWLVSRGMARAYRRYSDAYAAQEGAARAAGQGLWAGAWDAPSQVRHGRLAGVAPGAGRGCAIKGNISANGRLYHLPGSAAYAATRIDESRGERWFCSEAEAEAAGWRRAGG